MKRFVHESLPARVVFGAGALAELPAEVERLGLARALTLATPQQRRAPRRPRRFSARARPASSRKPRCTRRVDVTDRAMQIVRERGVDGLIAVGGGSTTGLGKAIALRTDLPQIVAPTTYAGSEMTPILGETEGRREDDHPRSSGPAGDRDLRRRSDLVAAAPPCRRPPASTRSRTRWRRSTRRTAIRSSR